jgi:hypothetical protein
MPDFVLRFTVPDNLTSNMQCCNVDKVALIRITFRVSRKQSKHGESC